MKQPNIAVYGSHSSPDSMRTTEYLDANGIQYEFKDVNELPEYNAYIATLNDGTPVLPTVRVDNTILIKPTQDELSRAIVEASTATS